MAEQEVWYTARDGQQYGPFDFATLKEMAANGQLVPADLVWRPGMTEWAPAGNTGGLFPARPPLPPRPPIRTLDYHTPAHLAEQKDWVAAMLLCFFLGGFGIHRFYTGHTGIGLLQLLTCGGCGIWAFVDLILILVGSYTDANGLPLRKN